MSVSQNTKFNYLNMYYQMVLIRRFEERVNELFMKGLIPSTLHLYIGQEAVAVGVCANLKKTDYILSTHRPHGHAIAKGVPVNAIMAELYGKADGVCKAKGGSMHVGDFSVGMYPAIAIVGGNVPIAAGAALAQKMKKDGGVTAVFFGDGATNEGAWHEAMNAAAIYDLPLVLVCENNMYAASTPVALTFRVENIADRAAAYGMPGVIVDGNDAVAVAETTAEAVERARSGKGPTLIECKTYRQCGHSRSDPRGYRTKEEEAEWLEKDPIPRHARFLESGGMATAQELEALREKAESDLDEAIRFAEASPLPDPAETYTDVFKE